LTGVNQRQPLPPVGVNRKRLAYHFASIYHRFGEILAKCSSAHPLWFCDGYATKASFVPSNFFSERDIVRCGVMSATMGVRREGRVS